MQIPRDATIVSPPTSKRAIKGADHNNLVKKERKLVTSN